MNPVPIWLYTALTVSLGLVLAGVSSTLGSKLDGESSTNHGSRVIYKLYYFDFRGRGEAIRLLLHYAGEPFEDFRIEGSEWVAEYKNKTPYGHVPVLELREDGRQLAESYAILRFLARRSGLAGVDEWEQAKVDEFADFHKDVTNKMHDFIFPPKVKPPNFDEDYSAMLTASLPYYSRQLKASRSGYLFSSNVTWADFLVADFLESVQASKSDAFGAFPELESFMNKVYALPQLATYLKGRKSSTY